MDDLQARLKQHIGTLTSRGARHASNPDGVRAALDYLTATLSTFGLPPRTVTYGPHPHNVNILLDLPGTDPQAPLLEVGAHWDSVQGSPGADDNASGVAGLLEVARALVDVPLRRSVRLCFFGDEESTEQFPVGRAGSHAHVQGLDPTHDNARGDRQDDGERDDERHDRGRRCAQHDEDRGDQQPDGGRRRAQHDDGPERPAGGAGNAADGSDSGGNSGVGPGGGAEGALVLEMIGYTDPTPGSQTLPEGMPDDVAARAEGLPGVFLAVVGNAIAADYVQAVADAGATTDPPLPMLPVLVEDMHGIDVARSDHWRYWETGRKGVMLTDTANFRNPHYHAPTDTLQTLDLDFAARVTSAVVRAIRTLAT